MQEAIHLAETETARRRCWPAMAQLRPHLSEAEFLAQVERQTGQGYHLAYLELEGRVLVVAGLRCFETLAWGPICYVDDLVAIEEIRSRGHGRRMFEWLIAFARQAGCRELHLDSGVHRFAAHRFYLTQRMEIRSHHFSLMLDPPPATG